MKFDQLYYFVETAKRQHIGKAAKFLHISPSAISHSIAALEEELGKPLFEKIGRRIVLTTTGQLLLERAETLLHEAKRIQEELAVDELKLRGHYRLAATHMLCSEFLAPTWLDIQHEHPNLTATFHSLRSGEVLAKVNAGEIDLGICFCPHTGPNHKQELLHRGKLLFAFGKEHPFLTEKNIATLHNYPCIASLAAEGIENCENHPSFKNLSLRPNIINLFDSYDVAIQALKTNRVWTLLPDFLAFKHRDCLETFAPPGWQAPYIIVAIWPKNQIRTRALDMIISRLQQLIQQTTLTILKTA